MYRMLDCNCEIVGYKDGSTPDLYLCRRHKLGDELTREQVDAIEEQAERHATTPARYFAGLVAAALAAQAVAP
jgi:hypothetical protein